MNKILLALSSSLVLLGACTTSEEIDGVGGSATFGDAVNFSCSVTRVADGQWQESDPVGIFSGEYYSNRKYIVTNSGATMLPDTDADEIFYVSDSELTYTAYYPYSSAASGGEYAIDLSDQDDLDAIDLLYASSTSDTDNVQLTFEHILSSVKFTFKALSGDYLPTDFKLKVSNVGVKSTLNLTNGEFSATPTLGEMEFEQTTSGSDAECSIESIMLPMASLASLKVEVYYNDTWWEADFGNLSEKSWESGKSYTYTITASTDTTNEVESIVVSGSLSEISTAGEFDSVQLTAKVYPLNTSKQGINWSSADSSIATVSGDGFVRGMSAGTTTITATSSYDSNISASYEVSVNYVPVAVGDYLFEDNSYGSFIHTDRKMLGVIYKLNEDGVSGSVVNVDEKSSTAWATSGSPLVSTVFNLVTQPTYTWGYFSLVEEGYSLEVMQAVYDVDPTFSYSPAFTWIASLNSSTVDYSAIANDENGVWFMPGEWDLKVILTEVWTGTSGLNSKIAAAGGSEFGDSSVYYTSCSEVPTNAANCRNVRWNEAAAAGGIAKTTSNTTNRVRAIMTFDLSDND